jgi:hypothetical protein
MPKKMSLEKKGKKIEIEPVENLMKKKRVTRKKKENNEENKENEIIEPEKKEEESHKSLVSRIINFDFGKGEKKEEKKEEQGSDENKFLNKPDTYQPQQENEKDKLKAAIKTVILNNPELNLDNILKLSEKDFKALESMDEDKLKEVLNLIYYKLSNGMDEGVYNALIKSYSLFAEKAFKIDKNILEDRLKNDKMLKSSLSGVLGQYLLFFSPMVKTGMLTTMHTVNSKIETKKQELMKKLEEIKQEEENKIENNNI